MERMLSQIAMGLGGLAACGYLLCRYLNYRPKSVEQQPVYNVGTPPLLSAGQTIKVVTYNVQFCAGVRYHFFHDGGLHTGVTPPPVRAPLHKNAKFVGREG